MDYNPINNFLDKFRNILLHKQQNYSLIVDIITKHIGVVVTQESIKIKGSIIYITGSPVLKSEIMVHKSGILADLSNLNSNQRFTDIK